MGNENVRLFGGVGNVWKEIGKLNGKPRLAAVAYLGDNAPYLLGEFGLNDIVVCDASDGSIKSGSTSRKALNDLVKRGVHVYSLRNLHAKVICIGQTAVVGSMNASASSTSMHEAAVLLRSDKDVQASRLLIKRFVAQSTEVDAQFLRRLGKMKVNNKGFSPVATGGSSGGSEYITIGAVHSVEHPKYVREAAKETVSRHGKLAGFKIKNCVAERGERRNLNIGELVVWVYQDGGDNPRLEIDAAIDLLKHMCESSRDNHSSTNFVGDSSQVQSTFEQNTQLDLVDQIERLVALHERGLLTEEEFLSAKRRIIN